jgi:hypothetical protein
MGDVPVPASSTLHAIVRRREEAHRVSNVFDSLVRLPATLASRLDDEDDEDDDNKGRASAGPSWELVARSWSEKKANKKEQVSEEPEDMEEVVEFPTRRRRRRRRRRILFQRNPILTLSPPLQTMTKGRRRQQPAPLISFLPRKSRESPPLLICTHQRTGPAKI